MIDDEKKSRNVQRHCVVYYWRKRVSVDWRHCQKRNRWCMRWRFASLFQKNNCSKKIIHNMKKLLQTMLSDSNEVSTKRVLACVIVLVLCVALFCGKCESAIEWLGWICITCIGGTSIEGVSKIFEKKTD